MIKLFPIATIHCHRPKNAGFDVKNDVISGVLFHLKSNTGTFQRVSVTEVLTIYAYFTEILSTIQTD